MLSNHTERDLVLTVLLKSSIEDPRVLGAMEPKCRQEQSLPISVYSCWEKTGSMNQKSYRHAVDKDSVYRLRTSEKRSKS